MSGAESGSAAEPPPGAPALGLFAGYGVELEYMVVDGATLAVRPIADALLAAAGDGTIVSDVDHDGFSWSNELVLHVVELKTDGPAPALAGLARGFQGEVAAADRLLAPLGARLMPTAMHPWMDPDAETRLWPHDHSPVYAAFDRIFGCRGHGWANLQSMHLNLPFAGDEEFARLHAAIRLLLPLLPALAASSPVVDGRPSGLLDTRLEVYRKNSRRIPLVAGRVIPEPVYTRGAYESEILDALYREIAPHDPEGVLREEWLNARGAIARFERSTIEIRVIDVQEHPAADLAIAVLAVAALRALVAERWVDLERQQRFAVAALEPLFLAALADGEEAVIGDRAYLAAFGLAAGGRGGRGGLRAGDFWRALAERLLPAGDEAWGALGVILEEGPLARRILRALGPEPDRERLRAVYGELCDCLREGRSFRA